MMSSVSTRRHICFTSSDEVRVWFVALPGAVPVARLRALQPAYARDRPGGTRGRHERLEANAALVLLGGPPGGDGAGWRREGGGRPVSPGGLPVSLSHSGGIAAVALAPVGVRVGVDVERRGPIRGLPGLARTAMAEPELRSWRAESAGGDQPAFLRRWVRKEAVLKALGVGLAGDLRAVVVDDGDAIRELPAAAGAPGRWTVRDLEPPGADTYAAVAVDDRARVVRSSVTTLTDLLEARDA